VTRTRETVVANVGAVRERVARACERAGREPDEVTIVAIGKTVPAEAVAWVVDAGIADVGENYVQELRAKHEAVPGARWHFVGTLQASSAHHLARLADVVQTVVPGRGADRLAHRSSELGRTLPVLVEIDFTGERAGVPPGEAVAACDEVAALGGLALRGLMTVAPLAQDREAARPWFRRLRDLRDRVRERHPEAAELSMGMSLDYEVAVGEGATMVRVGTALYGARSTA
jgi:pyridoxal phosphate enzyme (YggS family)